MAKKCQACDSEDLELAETPAFCNDCGEEVEDGSEDTTGCDNLVVVGVIAEAGPVAGKDKLTKLKVEVGGGEEVVVVTNVKHCEVGKRVVVARVGATVSGMEEPVSRATVGGVKSEGMLCDCPMLGWSGGAAGQAVFLPETFGPGDKPPASRPRQT